MVVGVTNAVVQLISVSQVWLMASGPLGRASIVVPDIAAVRWGKFPPTRRSIVLGLERVRRTVSLGGTTCRGDVHEVGLRVPPLYGALSLLYCRSFQQVS